MCLPVWRLHSFICWWIYRLFCTLIIRSKMQLMWKYSCLGMLISRFLSSVVFLRIPKSYNCYTFIFLRSIFIFSHNGYTSYILTNIMTRIYPLDNIYSNRYVIISHCGFVPLWWFVISNVLHIPVAPFPILVKKCFFWSLAHLQLQAIYLLLNCS